MEGYKNIKEKHNWKRHKKLIWVSLAMSSSIALVIAVTALIMSIVTIAEVKGDKVQSQRQFTLEDAKQVIKTEQISTAKHKRISLPPVSASGHVLFLQSDRNDGPSFTNYHPVPVKLDVDSYHRGINVSDEGITILYSGIYWVYNSVHYKLSTKNCSKISYQEWFFYIIRHNLIDDLETTLLKSSYICCEECEETKFIDGLFNLESGDLISVKSSGQNLLSERQELSFLGLVMLSSGETVTR